jgi:alcohol dehydrogenase
VPDPTIVDETDAVVCHHLRYDVHILKGDVPAVTDGRILGDEAVGTVEQVGAAVTTIRPGDRVVVSCISAYGRWPYWRGGQYGQSVGGGGWILGHLVDGTQAEKVGVPFADTSTYRVPRGEGPRAGAHAR